VEPRKARPLAHITEKIVIFLPFGCEGERPNKKNKANIALPNYAI
jgi:hypothetical protein